MSTALLVVDYQNDFLPNGALGVADGHKCQPVISRISRLPGVEVIALSRDWHPADHVSFSNEPTYGDYSWPPHCVQNTEGAEFDDVLIEDLDKLGKPRFTITKGVTNEKDQYSAFEGGVITDDEPYPINAETAFGIYGISRILVAGLALDYCVRWSALDAVKAGFDTTVIIEGTRPVAYESSVAAVAEMTEAGVKFVSEDNL